VQLYASVSDSKSVENIPGKHFVQAFSALRPHSWESQDRLKSATVRTGVCVGGGCCNIVTLFFAQVIFDQNWPVRWSIVMKEKSNVGSQFWWAFPS